ncbi:hypothetical protein ACFL27_06450 [candidate division CSSED10-310 bacterium]|uniref:Uncharacterized protein n=1 Tax=candidate division CSSED10-310 bacterium TaxID=2855610 RepID=A0ABV6YUF2_UNCC1
MHFKRRGRRERREPQRKNDWGGPWPYPHPWSPFGILQHVDPLSSISPRHTTRVKNLLHVGIPRAIAMTILDGVAVADLIVAKYRQNL